MDPSAIIFAIEAAVRLGRKLSEVLVDETLERPLMLPLGDLYADLTAIDARAFFDREENRHLVQSGGPYADLGREDLTKAYATLIALDERLRSSGGVLGEASEIITGLYRFEQLRRGFGANAPMQRVLGAVVETGVDYFAAHPAALGRRSPPRRVLEVFLRQLDQVELSEDTSGAVVADLLLAVLTTLDGQAALVDDDLRLQGLLSGVSAAVIGEVERAAGETERMRREDWLRRVGSGLLRGTVAALGEGGEALLPADPATSTPLASGLRQLLAGVRHQPDLFSNESLERLVRSALGAVAENPELLGDGEILGEIVGGSVEVLSTSRVAAILGREAISTLLVTGLDATAQNVETLVTPDDPRRPLVAHTIASLAEGLSDELAGGPAARNLLSRRQRVALAGVAFERVAAAPEILLGGVSSEPRATALAQIIASVTAGLGESPQRLLTGRGLLELLSTALRVGARNAGGLLDLADSDPGSNPLFRIVRELATAMQEEEDPRQLLARDVFAELLQRTLPVVSANLGALLGSGEPVVQRTAALAFELAAHSLAGRVNGDNFPTLVSELLSGVLRREIDPARRDAVVKRAKRILRDA